MEDSYSLFFLLSADWTSKVTDRIYFLKEFLEKSWTELKVSLSVLHVTQKSFCQ